ncbi:MAG: PaaI family thioesterase [Bacteroidales bacterium]|nr:PaaI family thioesterase [Bacteroidales bacterium]
MNKLQNPYASYPEYNCFGCSPTNPIGLKMEFFEQEDEIVCVWNPGEHYQGFHDVLHGGIQATMMDEIASWVVFMKLDTGGVTYSLNTRYRKSVIISKGAVTLRANLSKHSRSLASIEVKLLDGEGTVCSEGMVEYFILSREKAERELHFPGKQAFYEK